MEKMGEVGKKKEVYFLKHEGHEEHEEKTEKIFLETRRARRTRRKESNLVSFGVLSSLCFSSELGRKGLLSSTVASGRMQLY